MTPQLQDGTETVWAGCLWCRHLREGATCDAYPKGIPHTIQMGLESHLLERGTEVKDEDGNRIVYELVNDAKRIRDEGRIPLAHERRL